MATIVISHLGLPQDLLKRLFCKKVMAFVDQFVIRLHLQLAALLFTARFKGICQDVFRSCKKVEETKLSLALELSETLTRLQQRLDPFGYISVRPMCRGGDTG